MAALSAAARAAERLRAEADALARALTDRLYAEMPALLDRYGAVGRQKCLQDMGYNLEHLAPAVELADPAVFARYARWLDDLLRARGIPTGEVRRSLELMEQAVHERFPPDEADAVVPCIRAGLAALAGDGGPR